MFVVKGGNQIQEYGKQGVGGQYFMWCEVVDKSGFGEMVDKEVYYCVGQVVGGEIGCYFRDFFNGVVDQIVLVGGLCFYVVELCQYCLVLVVDMDELGERR